MNYESDDIYHINPARWAEVEDEPFYDHFDQDSFYDDEDEFDFDYDND